MTNLLLFHPGIMEDTIRIRTTGSFNEDTPVNNLTTGERFSRARLSTASSWVQALDFELPSATSQSADFWYGAVVDKLRSTVEGISFRGASASYFSGEEMTSITAWYDTAYKYYKTTSTVMYWVDRSPNLRDMVQTTDANRFSFIPAAAAGANGFPTFKSATSQMVGAATINLSNVINAGRFTIWTVIKTGTDITTFRQIWRDSAGYMYLYIQGSNLRLVIDDGASKIVSKAISASTFYLCRVRHDGSNIYISLNTASESSLAAGNVGSLSNPLILGSTTNPFDGNYCEIIFNNQNVGSAQTPIDYYLMAKWITAAPLADTASNTTTLYGPKSADYISTFSTSGPFRFWWVIYTPSGLTDMYHSKSWGGQAFDMGKEADYEIELIQPEDVDYTYDSGARRLERTTRPIYRLSMTWTGVTDAKVTSFQNIIARYSDNRTFGLVIPTSAITQPLDGHRVIHCRLMSAECQKVGGVDDYNIIRAEFEELVG